MSAIDYLTDIQRNEIADDAANELELINADDIDPSTLKDRKKISCLRNFCAFTCGIVAGQIKAAIVVTEKT